jgi:hypothetical protein
VSKRGEAATRREIESRIKYLEEDYTTARKAVLRENLTSSWSEPLSGALEDNLPGDKQLPDEGAWIQVTNPPHCEITAEFLSVWYALPAYDAKTWDFMEGERENRYLVKVLTPVGEFRLYPSEYRLVSANTLHEYMTMLGKSNDQQAEHVVLHWLDARNEYFDTDRLFYIMSRGVSRPDAYKMLMGEVHSQHVCYFTLHEEYQHIFAGVGVSSLKARKATESHIRYVSMEKAAGRWYNADLIAKRQAEHAAYEVEWQKREAEAAVLRKNQRAAEKRFGGMIADIGKTARARRGRTAL